MGGVKGKVMQRLCIFALLLSVGFASASVAKKPKAKKYDASAQLLRSDGTVAGSATLTKGRDGITLRVLAAAPGAGAFGMHMHAVGKCEGPDFASAGPHWNPSAKQHGHDNPMGSHDGDLPNVSSNSKGKVSLVKKFKGYVLDGPDGMLDLDGLSIIIHEKADDYKTDPSGNSGKRILCGVFRQ
jgi:superoxide dismutase, Cu-Zn family